MIVDQQASLFAADGVRIHAVHRVATDRSSNIAFVVVHGFTGNQSQPRVVKVTDELRDFGGVVSLDLRGHGKSGGSCTVGMDEVLDVTAAVAWARRLGYRHVVTVGFSMGGSVVVRQGAIFREARDRADVVVSVSAPAFWYYRGTGVMRFVHHMVLTRTGRALVRARRVRVGSRPWPTPPPLAPADAAAIFGHTPLLIVHGTVDRYFPLEHPRALYRAAINGGSHESDLWIIDGFDHAESAIERSTVRQIGAWASERVLAQAKGMES